jgi:hypothetical protein
MDRRIVVISTIRSHFLVNGKANDQFEHYIPKDGDTILISYDNNDDLHKQLTSQPTTENYAKARDFYIKSLQSEMVL